VTITVAEHPRAVVSVRRARALAGLAGFLLGALLAHKAALPTFDMLLRALMSGVAAHMVGWMFAIAYWRAVIQAELEVARQRRAQAREEADRVLRETAEAAAPTA
jgi:hypothetical protein